MVRPVMLLRLSWTELNGSHLVLCLCIPSRSRGNWEFVACCPAGWPRMLVVSELPPTNLTLDPKNEQDSAFFASISATNGSSNFIKTSNNLLSHALSANAPGFDVLAYE